MATTISIVDKSGAEVATVDLDASWLEREKGEQAVHDSVVAFMARNRRGTASTKTRSEVAGTGAKPYRQKGTGRARAGTRKSPIWRGGGIVFGPKPRDYSKRVNRKVERLALRRAFTERLDAGDVIVVDDIELSEVKTKAAVAFLNGVGAGTDTLILTDDPSAELQLAARNLPDAAVMKAASVNTYYMLLFSKIVITRAGLDVLGSRISVQEKGK